MIAEIKQFGPSLIITHLSARPCQFLLLVSPNDISIHQNSFNLQLSAYFWGRKIIYFGADCRNMILNPFWLC